VRLQLAQLVQLPAVAVGDHAALAHHRGRIFQHGPPQEREALGRHLEIG
jgi:hypothetical protein